MNRVRTLSPLLLATALGCGRLDLGDYAAGGGGAADPGSRGGRAGSAGAVFSEGGTLPGTAGSKFAFGGEVTVTGGSNGEAGSSPLAPLGDGGVSGASDGGAAGEGGGAGDAGDAGAGGGGGEPPPEGPDPSPAPSCNGSLLRCGVDEDSCCQGYLAPRGTFTIIDDSNPPIQDVTVDSFVLDRYEVTVARFRRFVDDYDRWRAEGNPREGAGSYFAAIGWQSSWETGLPNTASELAAAVTECELKPPWVTWSATGNDTLPINCITWHEAFAFCLWDGGRLPTETEFDYASAGGDANLLYPWGAAPEPSPNYAVYGCRREREPMQSDGRWACTMEDILPVGSKPLGFGRFRHADLAGSMSEWMLNVRAQPGEPSYDADQVRMFRGGNWMFDASHLRRSARSGSDGASRFSFTGVRCARTLE